MSSRIDPQPSVPPQQPPQQEQNSQCALIPKVGLRPGIICPRCGQARIDYDGLLQLVCPNCGLTEAGACT